MIKIGRIRKSLGHLSVFNRYIFTTNSAYSIDRNPVFYVIPEIPECNASDNSWACPTKIPDVTSQNIENVFLGLSKLYVDQQVEISEIIDQIIPEDGSLIDKKLFHNLIDVISVLDRKLNILLMSTNFQSNSFFNSLSSRIYEKIKTLKSEQIFASPKVFIYLLRLKNECKDLNNDEKIVLEYFLRSCFLLGSTFDLPAILPKSSIKNISQEYIPKTVIKNSSLARHNYLHYTKSLEDLENKYSSNIVYSSAGIGPMMMEQVNRHEYSIQNLKENSCPISESDLAIFSPSWLPSALNGNQVGGHILNMNCKLSDEYVSRVLLANSENKDVRSYIWENLAKRSTIKYFYNDIHLCNDKIIEEIRLQRLYLARLLQYPDFLSYAWDNKAAYFRSPLSAQWLVDEVLDPLLENIKPQVLEDWRKLKDYAEKHPKIKGNLEYCDLPFAINSFNNHQMGKKSNSVFPLDESLKSVLAFVSNQLNIELVMDANSFQRENSPSAQLVKDKKIQKKCQVIKVVDKENTEVKGEILLDLFSRKEKVRFPSIAITMPILDHTESHTPFSTITGQFLISDEHSNLNMDEIYSNTFLTFDDVKKLAGVIAKALQHILVKRNDLKVLNFDSSLIYGRTKAPSLSSWIRDDSEAIRILFENLAGEMLDIFEKFPKSSQSQNYIQSFGVLEILEKVRFDLAVNTQDFQKIFWSNISKEIHEMHSPFDNATWFDGSLMTNSSKESKELSRYWPCSYDSIFGINNRSTMLYSDIWSHLVAFDLKSQIIASPDKMKTIKEAYFYDYYSLGPKGSFSKMTNRNVDYKHFLNHILGK